MILRDSFKGSSTSKFHTKMTRRINKLKPFQKKRSLSSKIDAILRSKSSVNTKKPALKKIGDHPNQNSTVRLKSLMGNSMESIHHARKLKTETSKKKIDKLENTFLAVRTSKHRKPRHIGSLK